MSEEYIVARADYGTRGVIRRLIHIEAYEEELGEGGDITSFFESGYIGDVETVGRVQIVGDTDQLDDVYLGE